MCDRQMRDTDGRSLCFPYSFSKRAQNKSVVSFLFSDFLLNNGSESNTDGLLMRFFVIFQLITNSLLNCSTVIKDDSGMSWLMALALNISDEG